MKTKKTRILCLLLAVLTLTMSLSVQAFAAAENGFSNLSSSNYAKTFCLGTSGTVIPYTSSTLKTRGTTSEAQSGAWIDAKSDELYIFSIGKNSSGVYYAYCSYPGTSKRVNAYVKLSDIVYGASVSHTKTTATGKMYMATKSSNSLNTSYWIDKGDPV